MWVLAVPVKYSQTAWMERFECTEFIDAFVIPFSEGCTFTVISDECECTSRLHATTQLRWQDNLCRRRGKTWVGIWIYCLKKKQPFGSCGSIVLFLWCCGSGTILDVLWWDIVAKGALMMIVMLQLRIFTLFCCTAAAGECPCPRSCFSPSELRPFKPLQPFVFSLPFCQMRH